MKKISELSNLKNRAAIVVGGAGHIGEAICEALMELGSDVVVWDCLSKACIKRCDKLNSCGFSGKATPVIADLSDERLTRKAVRDAAKKLGRIDIIVHSAAFIGTTKYPGWVAPFEEQSIDAWDAAMRVNLTSAFIIVQEAKPFLIKSNHASVILISSIHGLVGPDMSLYEGTKMGNPAAYGASKAALIQLVRYLTTLLAPRIRVNAITPGGIRRNPNEKFHKRYKKRTPMGRMGTEEDIKGAIAYLASDLSVYVTGSNIVIDGGYTAW